MTATLDGVAARKKGKPEPTAEQLAAEELFEQQYGRVPSQRELARLAQASNFATRAAKTTALEPGLEGGTGPARDVWSLMPPRFYWLEFQAISNR